MASLIRKASDVKTGWLLIGLMISVLLSITGVFLTIYFQTITSTKFNAEKAAKAQVAQVVLPPFCKLARGYADLGVATTGTAQAIDRSRTNALNWAALAKTLNCK